jgi:virulence-associated protein VagC
MMRAKVINDGDGQIIVFPPEFHIHADTVEIRSIGAGLELRPRRSLIQRVIRLFNPRSK